MVITGIIRPPPDIRAVADKTASYVANKGRAFEARILNSAKGKSPQFAFLHESSPFHAYYEDRIRFFEEGGDDDEDANKTQPNDTTNAVEKDGNLVTVKGDANVDVSNKDGKETTKTEGDSSQSQSQSQSQTQTQTQTKENKDTNAIINSNTKTYKASALDPVARALLAQRSKIASQRETAATQNNHDTETIPSDPAIEPPLPPPPLPPPPSNQNIHTEEESKTKVNGITAPPPLQFVHLSAPSNCTPVQLDVIKLVAQFTALQNVHNDLQQKHHKGDRDTSDTLYYHNNNMADNHSFLRELTRREWNNPSLGFVQPRHASFAYFTALVDCYKQILLQTSSEQYKQKQESKNIPETTTEETKTNQNEYSLSACLELAAYRAEFDRDCREQYHQKHNAGNADDSNFGGSAYIDWHDFVVVETIDFPVHEVVAMLPPPPPPTCIPTPPSENPNETTNVPSIQQTQPQEESDDDMKQSSDEEMDNDHDKEEIRIDPSYQPRVISSQSTMHDPSRTHVFDPISGQSVPLSQMSQHLRIQLLDPKWAEERKKFQDKQKESNLGGDIARNITAFVGKKRDGDTMMATDNNANNTHMTGNSTTATAPVIVGAATAAEEQKRLEEATRIALAQQQQQQQQQQLSIPMTMAGVMPGMNTSVPLPPLPPHTAVPNVPMPAFPSSMIPHIAYTTAVPGAYGTAIPLVPTIPPTAVMPTANLDENTAEISTTMDESELPPNKKPRLEDEQQQQQAINEVDPTTGLPIPISLEEGAGASIPPSSPPPPPKAFPSILQLHIRTPSSSSNTNSSWNLNGQTIVLCNMQSSATIKSIKEQIRMKLDGGMPLNKMQIKDDVRGVFLKDALLLKDCGLSVVENESGKDETNSEESNIVVLDLVPKVRGGRK